MDGFYLSRAQVKPAKPADVSHTYRTNTLPRETQKVTETPAAFAGMFLCPELGPAYVAIPAKNEAAEIGPCLMALASQQGAVLAGAVVCLNDCSDDSAGIVGAVAPSLPFPVHVLDVALPPSEACAGLARRIAMDHAASLAGPRGVVLTTDADGRVAPDWLAVNLAALRAGADAVAGQADIDPAGAALIPPHLHAIDARECAYAALLDEIRALLDPDPADPWPRHDEHSGASIAVTVAAYRRAGGMPPVRLAEDRAFFDALRAVDARIRHDRAARVTVSARIVGRAQGGMADTIRRRIEAVDEFLDDRLEPVADAMRRARLHARLHRAWREGGVDLSVISRALGVSICDHVDAPFFGMVWAGLEKASPVLQKRRVPLAGLSRETERACIVRDRLRGGRVLTPAEDPADMPLRVAAE